jgi:hypothetical protein
MAMGDPTSPVARESDALSGTLSVGAPAKTSPRVEKLNQVAFRRACRSISSGSLSKIWVA